VPARGVRDVAPCSPRSARVGEFGCEARCETVRARRTILTAAYHENVPIYDTFSKRNRGSTGTEETDVYRYDELPTELRTQIYFILRDALGRYEQVGQFDYVPPANARWEFIHGALVREHGVFTLTERGHTVGQQVAGCLLTGSVDSALDVIELGFRFIDRVMRDLDEYQREGVSQRPDDAIDELNHRFQEHGVGYRYENDQLVRIDSELLHREVTVPAIALLLNPGFEGPLEEFMSAHDHYRRGEMKDANVDALNALESTLKAICDKRNWKYAKAANGAELVKLVVREGLIPPALQGQFEHLLKAMQAGLPPVRHNFGGHGQGAQPKTVEDHLAAYSLHLMAANIVLLIEAHRALP